MEQLSVKHVDATSPDLQKLIKELDVYLSGLYPPEEIFTVDFQASDISQFYFVVAYMDGDPVGCGGIHPLPGGEVELKRFFVYPAYRRRGIAASLLHMLEDVARQQGASAIKLETGEPQAEAVRFYRKHGYRDIDKFGEYVDCPSSLCMEKKLNDA